MLASLPCIWGGVTSMIRQAWALHICSRPTYVSWLKVDTYFVFRCPRKEMRLSSKILIGFLDNLESQLSISLSYSGFSIQNTSYEVNVSQIYTATDWLPLKGKKSWAPSPMDFPWSWLPHSPVHAGEALESLAVAFERFAVVALPCGTHRRAKFVGAMTLGAEPSVGLACSCQASQLSVLVDRVHNPVDSGILHATKSLRGMRLLAVTNTQAATVLMATSPVTWVLCFALMMLSSLTLASLSGSDGLAILKMKMSFGGERTYSC